MGWVEALQRAIECIETNLTEPITIEDISKEAGASPFHFQRVFSLLTDMTVADYLRKRRLTRAAQDLVSTDERIIDIALKYGYETPESFAKAFRRQHGFSPTEARKPNQSFNSYNRLMIQVNVKGAEPMKYKIVEKNSFQVAGKKQTFSITGNENIQGIPVMWGKMNGDGTTDQLFALNDGEMPGVLGVCVDKTEDSDNHMIDYWIAVSYSGKAPEGFDKLDIPAAKWVVFEVHGPMPDAMQQAWKKMYAEWFPSNSYKHAAGIPELEMYPDQEPYKEDSYSEIWIPVQ